MRTESLAIGFAEPLVVITHGNGPLAKDHLLEDQAQQSGAREAAADPVGRVWLTPGAPGRRG
jgi:carbamate kinase